jgi:apolipoprotein N-acyltransferase
MTPARHRTRAAAALVAGLALAFSFPNAGIWPLAPAGVALLAVAVRTRPGEPGRPLLRGAVLGFITGFAFFIVLLSWLLITGTDAWLILTVAEAAYFVPLGAGIAAVSRLPGAPVWQACLWVAEEALRDRWPLGGFSWGRLAFSQSGSAFTRYASLGGAPLLTFVVALAGGLVAVAVAGGTRLRWRAASALGAVALACCGLVIPLPAANGRAVTAGIVQGNVPHLGLDFLGRAETVLHNHVNGTERLASLVRAGRLHKPDLVILPEDASDVDPYGDPAAYALIQSAVRDAGVPTLIGTLAFAPDGQHLYNRGVVWDPRTGPGAYYDKQHLVPFGEYVPWRSLLGPSISELQRIPYDQVPGHHPGALRLGPATVGDVICFEIAYDGIVRSAVTHGGQAIVVQTNNADWGLTAQPVQQLAIARLRAVEHDRPVLIAATSGISAVIGPDGRVIATTRQFTPALLDRTVRLSDARTLADQLGEVPEWLLVIAGTCAAGYAVITRRAGRGRAGTPDTGQRRAGSVTGRFAGRTVVIMPTYNERDNLEAIVARLRAAVPAAEVLVVDDNSPDGTGEEADRLAASDSSVHVLHRAAKAGLGAAYIAGFRWALERDYDAMVEMDADGSHQPEELPRLLGALGDADLVLGSRYMEGGRTENWARSREMLSRGANTYTRLMLGIGVRDATGGFRAYRATTLRKIDLNEVESQGYCFQIDLALRATRAGLAVAEVPITFVERSAGTSKMNKAIVREALLRVTVWGIERRLGWLRGRLTGGAER